MGYVSFGPRNILASFPLVPLWFFPIGPPFAEYVPDVFFLVRCLGLHVVSSTPPRRPGTSTFSLFFRSVLYFFVRPVWCPSPWARLAAFSRPGSPLFFGHSAEFELPLVEFFFSVSLLMEPRTCLALPPPFGPRPTTPPLLLALAHAPPQRDADLPFSDTWPAIWEFFLPLGCPFSTTRFSSSWSGTGFFALFPG